MTTTQAPAAVAAQVAPAQVASGPSNQQVAAPVDSTADSAAAATQSGTANQRQGLTMMLLWTLPPTAKKLAISEPTNGMSTDRYTSKMLLQRVHTTDNVADATDFTIAIVKLYSGKGMHPLSAIKKLATFPSAFDLAIDQIFEAFAKASHPEIHSDHSKYWKSIRKPQGALGRYIKNFDQALTWIVSTHWLRLVKEGKDLDWLPMYLEARIQKVWSALLDASSPPQKYSDVLTRRDPTIFSTSLGLLKFCQTRCTAGIKVMRVAGHRLPPELVNLIKEMAVDRGEFLQTVESMLSGYAGLKTQIVVVPTGQVSLWYNRRHHITTGPADPQKLQSMFDRCPRIGD